MLKGREWETQGGTESVRMPTFGLVSFNLPPPPGLPKDSALKAGFSPRACRGTHPGLDLRTPGPQPIRVPGSPSFTARGLVCGSVCGACVTGLPSPKRWEGA